MKKYFIALSLIFSMICVPCIANDDEGETDEPVVTEASTAETETETEDTEEERATTDPHPEDPPPPPLDGDADAPVDGGVSLLIAGGIGYGVKKIRDARRKKKSTGL